MLKNDRYDEQSFFNAGDALAAATSQWEPYSPERAARRRGILALAVTFAILTAGALSFTYVL